MYKQSAPESIQALFASIAKNYDKANATFTFGLHKRWNQKLIELFSDSKHLLDLCAGTGDVACAFLKKNPNSRAILLDFCAEMLEIAAYKGSSFKDRFEIIQGDAQAIPLPDAFVDGVSISYGIRNVKNPEKCIQEVYRVLAKGGTFGILEATCPTSPIIRLGHRLYTHQILPLLGKLTAKNGGAYAYLANSVQTFAPPSTLKTYLERAGFHNIKLRPLMGGITTLFSAVK